MTLILLEALGAGLLLVLIVWWTMFSGRERGEPRQDSAEAERSANDSPTSHVAVSDQDAPPPKDPAS